MKLKVASWNMGHWLHRNMAKQAWDYLDKEISPDIALLQESALPTARQDSFSVWREIGGKRKWGSAVLTKDLPLVQVSELKRNDYPGALTVVDVTLPDNSSLIVVSVYVQLDDHGYSIPTLHRMLSDLTHLFDGKLRKGRRPKVILGGDFNASPQFDDQYKLKTHRNFFQRLEALGLVDCQGQFTNARPRTLRHRRSRIPWVNDYIFASESLKKKIITAEVVEDPAMLDLSDHNPVVVTLDL